MEMNQHLKNKILKNSFELFINIVRMIIQNSYTSYNYDKIRALYLHIEKSRRKEKNESRYN